MGGEAVGEGDSDLAFAGDAAAEEHVFGGEGLGEAGGGGDEACGEGDGARDIGRADRRAGASRWRRLVVEGRDRAEPEE